MSLINQVLKDLDERRAAEFSENKTELDDLHFAHTPKPQKNIKPIIIGSAITVSVIAVAIAGFYFYNQFTTHVEPQVVSSEENKPVVKAASATTSSKATTKPVASVKQDSVTPPPVVKQATKPKSVTVSKQPVVKSTVAKDDSNELATSSTDEIDEPDDNTPAEFTRSSVPLRPEQKAERAYQRGYDYLKAQRHRQAEQTLRQSLTLQPGHIKARELLSGIYIKQGRWIEVSELLRQGLSYSPQHLTFSKLYARALMQLNRDNQAIEVLKRYAPPVQQDPNYFAILAALYQRQNQHVKAVEVYAKLVTVKSHNGVWWVGLGISLEALGRQQDAKQAYGHARKTGNLQMEVARFTDNRLLALEEINFPSDSSID